MFDEMSNHRDTDTICVLRVMVSQALYPVTKEVFHRIFDSYGAEDVYMTTRTDRIEALVMFRSRRDAARARDILHGRNIYDGCCLIDIHESTARGLLRITISQVLYPVTPGVLHQVFDAYGFEDEVYMYKDTTHVRALLQFQSSCTAERAQSALHGRNIYDGCLQMDIECFHLVSTIDNRGTMMELQEVAINPQEQVDSISKEPVPKLTMTSASSSSKPTISVINDNISVVASLQEALDKARSLVLLLATLTATITYKAGLDPPGGVWQDNGNGHIAGDPILLTTDARRYKAFFYCNSVAFVASLVAIVLVQKEILVKHHVLEAAMILDLFGLIGAYAAGSCRDMSTSIYAMALAGAVLVYVVIHVVFFTLDHKDKKDDNQEHQLLKKRRKRLLLFAILAATITYQAGLTPPGGFLLQDDKFGRHHAGDPVLLDNYPRRYNAFFYCNSISFMLSVALIILLVNPNLYRPAIQSNALSVCTAVGLFCLMGAYAAGSTQHLKTSIYIFVLVVVVLFVAAVLLLVFLLRELNKNGNSAAAAQSRSSEQDDREEERNEKERKEEEGKEKERKKHARRKYGQR